MAVRYSVSDIKIISNDTSTTETMKIRFQLRQILAKIKAPYEEAALDIVHEKFTKFLKKHDEHLTDDMKRVLRELYEKKVLTIKLHLEQRKVRIYARKIEPIIL